MGRPAKNRSGQRLKDTRIERGLSQRDLAEAVGVKTQSISNWERKDTPLRVDHLRDLAKTLRVGLEWLAFGDPYPREPSVTARPRKKGSTRS